MLAYVPGYVLGAWNSAVKQRDENLHPRGIYTLELGEEGWEGHLPNISKIRFSL